MKIILFFITSIILLNSCATTSTSVVASNIRFSNYEFAAIGTRTTGSNVVLMDAHMRIQNALETLGFNVIIDTRINTLTIEERNKLFIVEFSMTSTLEESICLIYITDHSTGNLLATCRGAFGLGWNIAGDQRGAIDRAIQQMENVIRNNR